MDELQLPVTVLCGGRSYANHDVSIRLVPNGINQQQVTDSRSREAVAVVKVHSHRLKECSKYFETCLSERWANPNPSTSSIETSLEVIHGLEVACYIDCFSRMYTPFLKDFKDVKSSLNLLRVASQIGFHNLMSTICRSLSTIVWSVEDELRIRLYSSSVDFPRRDQAEDLLTQLEFGDPSNNACKKQLFVLLIEYMKSALRCGEYNRVPRRNFPSARSLIEEVLLSIGHSGSSVFETDVVVTISHEVEDTLADFQEECRRHGGYSRRNERLRSIYRVPGFERKLEGICWILKVLLKAKVADDVVECFLQLQSYPQILTAATKYDPFNPATETKPVAIEFAKLVMLIYREAVSGNLLLDIEDRVALLENWQLLYLCKDSITDFGISEWGFEQAAEDVFLTLTSKRQMELIKRWKFGHHNFISAKTLATLVQRNCQAEEDASRLQADVDVDLS